MCSVYTGWAKSQPALCDYWWTAFSRVHGGQSRPIDPTSTWRVAVPLRNCSLCFPAGLRAYQERRLYEKALLRDLSDGDLKDIAQEIRLGQACIQAELGIHHERIVTTGFNIPRLRRDAKAFYHGQVCAVCV